MRIVEQIRHRIDLDFLVDEDGDTVADRGKAVQIVRDQKHRQAKALLETAD